MNIIRKIYDKLRKKPLLVKPDFRRSNIKIYCGGKYEISRAYEDLVNKEEIHITSVSITRVDHDGGRGYVDNYMIAVSYDYHA